MWRFGAAAALLLLLAVLVVDMLFSGHTPTGVFTARSTVGDRPIDRTERVLSSGESANESRERKSGTPARDGTASAKSDQGRSAEATQLPDLGRLPSAVPSDGAWKSFTPSSEQPAAEQPTVSVLPQRLEPVKRPSGTAPASSVVAEAQRALVVLGYSPGAADGHGGRRTERAVRDYQRDRRIKVDGRIDDRLVARLQAEARSRSLMRQQEMEAMAPAPPTKPEKKEPQRGVFGTVLGGFQRLLGRDFDSVRRPDEINAYCHDNPETWIYDFGREAFLYCGNVVASGLSGRRTTSPPPAASSSLPTETAATR